jgi:hypothetical protein
MTSYLSRVGCNRMLARLRTTDCNTHVRGLLLSGGLTRESAARARSILSNRRKHDESHARAGRLH